MAYTDLVDSQVTVATDTATTYNFAYDLPVSQDGSPHVTQMGFLLEGQFAADATLTSTLTGLINKIRIKVGSTTIINWDDVVTTGASAVIPQLSVVIQKLGGLDVLQTQTGTGQTFQAIVTWPVGIDATRSQRINVQIGFDDVSTWSAATNGFSSGATLSMIHMYGTAKEAVIIGSRQDYTTTDSAERVMTIYGKTGWAMLGVALCAPSVTADGWSDIRVSNGAFRALKPSIWRALNGTASSSPLQYLNSFTSEENLSPQWRTKQEGVEFLDLKRISAGSNIDIMVTSAGGVTLSVYPIFVAPIGAGSGAAPTQTAKTVQNTVGTVVSEGPQ